MTMSWRLCRDLFMECPISRIASLVSHRLASSLRTAYTLVFSHKPAGYLAVAVACSLGLLAIAGCGNGGRPTLGRVHGCVTLDGKPLADAKVIFRSQEAKVRESWAFTDASGEYVLKYLRDIMGGTIGKNFVRISKPREGARGEMLPGKYNTSTTLTADVKSGDNEINFDLTSGSN
jgi:hypothetical protein